MRNTLNGAALLVMAAAGAGLVYASRADQTSGAPAPTPTAIQHVRLFDGATVVEDATVVFDETGIVSSCAKCPAPAGARTIDGMGKTLLPGLIDAHTHSFGDALERALVFGVTTEIDMFTAASFAAQMRAEQKKGAFGRADLVSAGYLVTVAGGHGTEYGMPIPTYAKGMDAQKFIDDRIAEGSDFIKLVYDDGGAFKIGFKSLDASDLAALIAATKKRGKLAVVHVSTASAARDAVLAGANGLVHSWGDAKPDDAALLDEIVRRGVFIIPTLSVIASVSGRAEALAVAKHPTLGKYVNDAESAALRSTFPPASQQKEALDNAKRLVGRLRALNVALLAGSDAPNPGTAHGIAIHRELEMLVESGLTPIDALRAATSVPARTFGLTDRGTIAKGRRADLVLVSGDPTREISATQNIISIWKGGRLTERVEWTAKPATAVRRVTPGTLSDFETGVSSALGSSWMVSTDQMMGGKSTATLAVVAGGPGTSKQMLRVEGTIVPGQMYPWAGAMLFFSTSPPMSPVDIRPAREISFAVRSASPLTLMVFAASHGRIPVTKDLPAAKDWTTVTVSLQELGLDGSDMQGLLISGTGGAFSYELDNVAIR